MGWITDYFTILRIGEAKMRADSKPMLHNLPTQHKLLEMAPNPHFGSMSMAYWAKNSRIVKCDTRDWTLSLEMPRGRWVIKIINPAYQTKEHFDYFTDKLLGI